MRGKGFGSTFLESIVGAGLNGKSAIRYRHLGIAWQTELGGTHLVSPDTEQRDNHESVFAHETRLQEP